MLHHNPSEDVCKSKTIADGDMVIVYERIDAMKSYIVDAQKTYHGRFGLFPVKDWIGKQFGSRVYSKSGGGGQPGWVYLLAPTPELWTMVLRHRTQILYAADISMICMFLELQPGCTVLESGTGSGSLTHALARAIAPIGHVHTFDFHQQRATDAAAEFDRHGLGKLVTVQHRNIEENGFPGELHGKADALFLDLPGPWKVAKSPEACLRPDGMFCAFSPNIKKVAKSAEACLRPDGIFCAFSPCIEQVQRTCEALASCSFTAPRTMECLLRSYEVSNEKMVTDLSRAEEAALAGRKRKRDIKESKEEKEIREKAIRARTERYKKNPDRGRDVPEVTVQASAPAFEPAAASAPATAAAGVPEQGSEPAQAAAAAVLAAAAVIASEGTDAAHEQSDWDGKAFQVLALPRAETRGHTGYLTFARRLVSPIEA